MPLEPVETALMEGDLAVVASGVAAFEMQEAVKHALAVEFVISKARIAVIAVERRRLACKSCAGLRGGRRLAGHWVIRFTIQMAASRLAMAVDSAQSVNDSLEATDGSGAEFKEILFSKLVAMNPSLLESTFRVERLVIHTLLPNRRPVWESHSHSQVVSSSVMMLLVLGAVGLVGSLFFCRGQSFAPPPACAV